MYKHLCTCLCMVVHTYIRMYVSMQEHTYVRNMYVIYVHTYVRVFVCVHVCVCVCVCVSLCIDPHGYPQVVRTETVQSTSRCCDQEAWLRRQKPCKKAIVYWPSTAHPPTTSLIRKQLLYSRMPELSLTWK